MPPTPTIVGVCGSLRTHSTTRTALAHALDAAAAAGASTTLMDLREYDIPIYNGDNPAAGDTPQIRDRLHTADAVILATPVYHATIASPLKAALDYCRRTDLEATTVGLLCTTGGQFYGPAFSHLRAVAQILDAWVLPHHVTVPNAGDAIDDDAIQDPDIRQRLDRLGEALVAYATIDTHPEDVANQALLAGD